MLGYKIHKIHSHCFSKNWHGLIKAYLALLLRRQTSKPGVVSSSLTRAKRFFQILGDHDSDIVIDDS